MIVGGTKMLSAMSEPEPEQKSSHSSYIAQVIEETTDLIEAAIPVLDRSTHGWWRLAVLALVFGGVAGGLMFAWKIDPNKPAPQPIEATSKKAEQDSLAEFCREIGHSVICDSGLKGIGTP